MSALLSWLRRSITDRDSRPGVAVVPTSQPGASGGDGSRLHGTGDLTLYHYTTCPFCVRVHRAMKRLGAEIEVRDIRRNREHYAELVQGGGKSQVPCLRVRGENGDVDWIYESKDIVRFLEQRLAAP